MEKVRVYKDVIKIPTYELLEDNLNPMFDRRLEPYPYTLQDHKSNEKRDKEYEVIFLENEYLKLMVIPSLGGRLYSAFDKRIEKEIFYKNAVIKPRMIATRGGWFSGGVEFNFPISHSPNTMSRVNYMLKEYEDGSASIIFGNIEQMSYMNWKVELRIYPGKAYIEQNVRLHNPTCFSNRFYFWTNAAVEYTPNVKLVYPFDWCTAIGTTKYIKWPYRRGVDCTKARDIPYCYETFGKLITDNFFGIYNYDKEYGVVHYADRKMVKGAKFFLWGNDERARAWNRALTDDDTQYLEIQSGVFESQRVYKFMRPYQELKWREYWYAVPAMGGFKYAEKELAVNYLATECGIKFIFAAVEPLNNCRIVLKIRGKEYTALRDMVPDKLETVLFDLDSPYKNGEHFELDIYTDNGHILSMGKREEFCEDYPDTDLYEDSRTRIAKEEENRLFNWATYLESVGKLDEALQTYMNNLAEHPGCVLTLNRMGRIYLRQRRLNQAEECFKEVLKYDNRNSEARFFYGVTQKEKGNFKTARKIFMDIAADSEYYMASVIELAKLNLLYGYYKDAMAILDSYINCGSSYIDFLASICYRKDGLRNVSQKILQNSQLVDEFLLAEQFILEDTQDEKNKLVSFTEGAEDVLLPIAMEYMDLNLYSEAKKILELINNPGLKTKILYYYISDVINKTQKQMLQHILKEPLDYAFINERKLVQILEQYQPDDSSGVIDYLLGNFYYAVGRKNDALRMFLSSYEKGLRYTVLLHNIGYIYYTWKGDLDNAAKYLEEDLLLNEGINEESLVYLDHIYKQKGELSKREKLIPYMEKVKNRSLILASLVGILRDIGQEERALSILEKEEFENWEGQEGSGELYRDVIARIALKEAEKGNLSKAIEYIERIDKYPKNINYGDAVGTSLADIHYHKGVIYMLAGEHDRALDEFRKGAIEFDHPDILHTEKSRRYSLKCLEELKKSM